MNNSITLSICNINKHFIFQSFVFVSTAFSNSHKTKIEEKVYEPTSDHKKLLACMDVLPANLTKKLTRKILVRAVKNVLMTMKI